MRVRTRAFCVAAMVGVAAVGPRVWAQTIHYVKNTPGGAGPWAGATADMRAALAAAAPGDQVWVAAGTYTPAPAGGDRTLSFVIPSGVRVHGGFAGTETSLAERAPDTRANPTILSGDLNGDDTGAASTRSDNAGRVVIASDTDASTLLDRFVVERGASTYGAPAPDVGIGAGVFMTAGRLELRDCVIRDNFAGPRYNDIYAPQEGGRGAGLYMVGSSPTVVGCDFTGNSCSGGFAYGCFSGSAPAAGPGGSGGAIYMLDSTPRIERTRFSDNHAGRGGDGSSCGWEAGAGIRGGNGGAIAGAGSSPTFVGCRFSDNAAGEGGRAGDRACTTLAPNGPGGSGGAVWLTGGSSVFRSCEFVGNVAGRGGTQAGGFQCGTDGAIGGSGGAVHLSDAAGAFVNCVFRSNAAGDGGAGHYSFVSHNGGAGGSGGAVATAGASSLSLIACTLSRNEAGEGGLGSPVNTPPGTPGGTRGADGTGGAIFVAGGTAVVRSSILSGHGATEVAGNSPVVTYSRVTAPVPGAGNFFGDPGFFDEAGGDLRLRRGSRCADAGDNGAIPAGVTTDVAGLPRLADAPDAPDAGNGAPPIVDMGAHERQPWTDADTDASGAVDLTDLFGFLSLMFGGSARADLDGDGRTNVADLFVYLVAYFRCC